MRLLHLKEIIDRQVERRPDAQVRILLSIPSIGPAPTCEVEQANLGMDWDADSFILRPELRLVQKTQDQDLWEQARNLLYWLASKPSQRPSYEIRQARKILARNGVTEGQLESLRRSFHPT